MIRRLSRASAARLAALVLAVAAPVLVSTSVGAPSAQAIVGGSDVGNGQLRFMASLQSPDGSHFCGGSVVAKRWILTAAHCSDRRPGQARVVVGKTDLGKSGGQTLRVTRIVVHPRWATTGTHDVALWRVDRPIKSPAISLVKPGNERYERSGARLTVAGWGTEFFGSPVAPDRLKRVGVEVVADADCTTNELLVGFRGASEFCAETLLGDSCQGDSGGPIFGRDARGRFVQVGAVSYGLGCATPGFPGVYAELNNRAIHRFLSSTVTRR